MKQLQCYRCNKRKSDRSYGSNQKSDRSFKRPQCSQHWGLPNQQRRL
ncbi:MULTISPECIES: hypothetical protein [Fischerella]|nr:MULTISPECIES: hypothetical protein [Fischerella]MBD2434582.1 hypothetical protein [Fischerella sp. FACHB-380]